MAEKAAKAKDDAAERALAGDRAAQPLAEAGLETAAQADRARRGQRAGQDLRARAQGRGIALGPKRKAGYEGGQNPIHMRMRKLRGPHKKKSMPFENFRTATQPVNLADLEERFDAGAEVTPETLKEKGLAKRSDPVKILARGEISKKLDGPRAWLQRGRQGEDRGGRRFLPHSGALMLRTIANAFSVADIRKKLAFTAAMLLLYRLGAYIPAPGVDVDAVKELQSNFGGGNILGFLNPSPAAASRASRSSRWGSCPTSPPRSSCSC